jgi:hypothetical protein
MARRLDMAAATSGKYHAGRRHTESLRVRVYALIAELALRLASIARKRFGFPFASGWLRYGGSGLVDAPNPSNQQHQQEEKSTDERIENELELHDQPLYSGD